ncbi:MAG: DUF4190 domain-containing protein [Propionicimonas sp.]|uniref:DUF4190 domain-containing protein n=1 Tax=Propionicimonas sp. TaxID=1955623 RepID=UPI003D0C3836
MTDPHAGPTVPGAADQTIPLVPEAGFAPAAQRPFEETLVDPLGLSTSPWSSGPGIGDADPTALTQPIGPAPTVPLVSSTPTAPAPAAPVPTAPIPQPDPAAPPYPSAPIPQARPYDQQASTHPAYGAAPTTAGYPAPAPARPAPAPAPQPAAQHYDLYPEPTAPAYAPASPYQTWAPATAPNQQWPAISDPVAYDYGYSLAPARSTHPNAATSMVLGILGVTVFLPLAPVAWYLAAKGRRETGADPYRWQPSGMLTAGLVLGIIGTAMIGLFVMFMLLMMMVAFTGF